MDGLFGLVPFIGLLMTLIIYILRFMMKGEQKEYKNAFLYGTCSSLWLFIALEQYHDLETNTATIVYLSIAALFLCIGDIKLLKGEKKVIEKM